jgi:hypothetical protein
MNGRFQRGKIGGISPFFAFQDIITSAMAVLITIVMLLALDMGEGGSPSSGKPAAGDLAGQLEQTLDELSHANAELRAGQETATAVRDPVALQGEIDILRTELAQVRGQDQASEKTLAETKRQDGAKIVLTELEKQKEALAAAIRAAAQAEQAAAQSLAAMQRAEMALRTKEGQLLSAQARKNELWLIPDRSQTSKEPILVVVSRDAVTLQRFDRPEKSELSGWWLASKFGRALQQYSKLNQYLVFYFKPSGVENFEALTSAARSAGFEIGYDAVGEEIAINFNTAP